MPKKVLSDSQFAGLFGGSRSVTTGESGPNSGYYVSRDPRVPVEIGGSEEVTAPAHSEEAVRSHLSRIKGVAEKVVPTGWMRGRAATPKEKANVFQGTWTDEGKTYLDVSDRIGGRASESSLKEALTRGLNQKQLGVYAAGAGKTLPIHKVNPTATTKSGKVIKLYKPEEEGKLLPNPAVEKVVKNLDSRAATAAENKKLTKKQRQAKRQKSLG